MLKLLNEVAAEIQPLASLLAKGDTQIVMNIRRLASGDGCETNPRKWRVQRQDLGLINYLDPYLQQGDDGRWRLASSPYTFILPYIIDEGGAISPRVAESAIATASRCYVMARLEPLCRTYWSSAEHNAANRQQLVGLFVQHADRANWMQGRDVAQDPLFYYVYTHTANGKGTAANCKKLLFDGPDTHLVLKPIVSREDVMWEYWRLLRNVWTHLQRSANPSNVCVFEDHLPSFLYALMFDMEREMGF
jgi:hypothetical protein